MLAKGGHFDREANRHRGRDPCVEQRPSLRRIIGVAFVSAGRGQRARPRTRPIEGKEARPLRLYTMIECGAAKPRRTRRRPPRAPVDK
jgi:hypothetical protein